MTRFKTGDRVERINKPNSTTVVVGLKGTVRSTYGSVNGSSWVRVDWDNGETGSVNHALNLKLLPGKIRVGDRVVYRNYKFGRDCYGTVTRVNFERVWADDWTVGERSGYLMSHDLEVVETVKPINPAPRPNNSGSYIVALEDEDGLHPNAKPKVHHDSGVALLEAERLATKYGGKFVVLKRMGHAERPPVIVPPTTLTVY